MGPLERKAGAVVVELGALPLGRDVAKGAILAESRRSVAGIRGFVEISQVAGCASGGRPPVDT